MNQLKNKLMENQQTNHMELTNLEENFKILQIQQSLGNEQIFRYELLLILTEINKSLGNLTEKLRMGINGIGGLLSKENSSKDDSQEESEEESEEERDKEDMDDDFVDDEEEQEEIEQSNQKNIKNIEKRNRV